MRVGSINSTAADIGGTSTSNRSRVSSSGNNTRNRHSKSKKRSRGTNNTKNIKSSSSATATNDSTWWSYLHSSSRTAQGVLVPKRVRGMEDGSRKNSKRRPVAVVAAFAVMCTAMLWVGALAFSRGYLAQGDPNSGAKNQSSATTSNSYSAPRRAGTTAGAGPTATAARSEGKAVGDTGVSAATKQRELARRPDLKTRGGQLAFARYTVLAEYAHDHEAFTQGLSFEGGFLYESTGLFGGKSSVRKVNPETGEVLQIVNLDAKHFGEGMTILNDEIHSLTWRSKVGFTWDLATFEKKKEWTFSTETGQGWGITTDGDSLIVSDGSEFLFFWDLETMEETRRIQVKHNGGKPLGRLNELEMIKGYVFANVWFDDHLYKIDPETGVVVDTYNFTHLYPPVLRKQETKSSEACLNGIAYDPDEDVLYLTGKLWPRMYKVKLSEDEEKSASVGGGIDVGNHGAKGGNGEEGGQGGGQRRRMMGAGKRVRRS